MMGWQEQPSKRGLLKGKSARKPHLDYKVTNPKTLEGLKKEVMDNMDGKFSCGLCGHRLALGDVYYNVNLSAYGCNTATEHVCGVCLDAIREELR